MGGVGGEQNSELRFAGFFQNVRVPCPTESLGTMF